MQRLYKIYLSHYFSKLVLFTGHDITRYSLLITRYSLLITHYSLLITHYSLLLLKVSTLSSHQSGDLCLRGNFAIANQ